MKRTLYLFLILLMGLELYAQKNANVAKTPPMGWNSWNWFGKKNINEKVVFEVIDSMAANGLRDIGFNYIIIDGGWRDTKLGNNGELLVHPIRFPNGMKVVADYAHSKGFKLGLHIVPGTHDCGGDEVGGYQKEEIHVKQMLDWGIDFIKLDLCIQKKDTCSSCLKNNTGWSEALVEDVYVKWSKLLYESGRDILFSVSAYKFRYWNPVLCNMSRTTLDMQCKSNKGAVFNNHIRENKNYMSVLTAAILNDKSAEFAGHGYWNDPDIMVTGNQGLSDIEQISHVALWSIISAPMILGNDPRHLELVEKRVLLDKDFISINQDPSEQGRLILDTPEYQLWKKRLSDGNTAILLLNISGKENTIEVDLRDLGFLHVSGFRDIIKKEEKETTGVISAKLKPNACLFGILK